ncbi:hypothetical protein HC174_14020 [Salinimicrobium sp. CDJ15-81-2]|nr:hypothetical protein [Salinimicrobium nanhaiense]
MKSIVPYDPVQHLKEILEQQALNVSFKELSATAGGFDARIQLNDQVIYLETKREISPVNLSKILEEIKNKSNENPILLVGDYITPKAKELLRKKEVNYLDSAGNMYLKLNTLLIHIEGKTAPTVPGKYRSRAFSKAGGAVVFQFLRDPQLVNEPQRLIAEYAGVSLGTIPKVFEGLQKEKYLIKLDKNKWELTNKERLLLKWTEVLREKILPSKFLGNYKPAGKSMQQMLAEKEIRATGLKWGGEPAAALLTNYLIAENFSLFVPPKENLIKKYKLFPSPSGELELYEKFWNHPEDDLPYVHPILIYAQLMATGESRNIETAEIILTEHIRPNL